MPSFNLVEQPWIPCRFPDGSSKQIGIQSILENAHLVSETGGETPLVRVSLLRLLVALVHRIYDGPATLDNWEQIWRTGKFDQNRVNAYFARWKSRFDLFDEKRPFMQVGGFAIVGKDGKHKPAATTAVMAHEASAGNNPLLFDHSFDDACQGLRPDEAVRRLLAHQFFAVGGGKGGTSNLFGEHPYLSGGPLMGGVVLMPSGDNLFETLLLNTFVPAFHRSQVCSEDSPTWEWSEFPAPGSWSPPGYLSELTAPSRYCRLVVETEQQESDGGMPMVVGIHTAQGLFPAHQKLSCWMASTALKDGSIVPLPMRVDRLLWRDANVFFAMPREAGRRTDGRPTGIRQLEVIIERLDSILNIPVEAYGIANDKAKLLAWRHEAFRVPGALLNDHELVYLLDDAVHRAEAIGERVVSSLFSVAKLVLFGDASYAAKGKENDRLRNAIEPNPFWMRMNEPFRRLLWELPGELTGATARWEEQCEREAMRSFSDIIDRFTTRRPEFLKEKVQAEFRLKAWQKKTRIFQHRGGEDVR